VSDPIDPLVGFLPPEDPRVRDTVAAIEREPLVDGLVQRYPTESGVDGLPPGEGVFLAQALSHIALINSASNLSGGLRLAEHRAGR
jgi:hypothetical protein